jgi:MFS family permease
LWVPAIGALLAGPAFGFGFVQTRWQSAAVFFVIGGISTCTYYGPTSAVIHAIVEPRMRATAIAICAFVLLILGTALGPSFVGLLSDQLGSQIATSGCLDTVVVTSCYSEPADGLRLALIIVSPLYAWAAAHYAIAARHIHGVTVN